MMSGKTLFARLITEIFLESLKYFFSLTGRGSTEGMGRSGLHPRFVTVSYQSKSCIIILIGGKTEQENVLRRFF